MVIHGRRASLGTVRRRKLWSVMHLALIVGPLAAVAGCPLPNSSANGDGDDGSANGGAWVRIDADASWQWQLQAGVDGINTRYDVDVYDIDLFDVPTEVIDQLRTDGRIVIAYFSAGTYEDFRDDAGEFEAADLGGALEDFADERWLDVRSENVRRIMLARLDLAAAKGFDGVEPDNMTGYVDGTGVNLTAADQLDYNRFIAREAHARGLAVGLKNDLEQIPQLVDDFDFAVNEQCHEFDECDAMQPFIDAGKPVFNAEYADEYVADGAARAEVCDAARDLGIQTLVLPVDLDDSFRLACE